MDWVSWNVGYLTFLGAVGEKSPPQLRGHRHVALFRSWSLPPFASAPCSGCLSCSWLLGSTSWQIYLRVRQYTLVWVKRALTSVHVSLAGPSEDITEALLRVGLSQSKHEALSNLDDRAQPGEVSLPGSRSLALIISIGSSLGVNVGSVGEPWFNLAKDGMLNPTSSHT